MNEAFDSGLRYRATILLYAIHADDACAGYSGHLCSRTLLLLLLLLLQTKITAAPALPLPSREEGSAASASLTIAHANAFE
jgi:hypothetical protein